MTKISLLTTNGPVSNGIWPLLVSHPTIILLVGIAGMLLAYVKWRNRNKVFAK